jgi:hypothetical protein
MKKQLHDEQKRNNRPSTGRKRHMIATGTSISFPQSVMEAHDRVQSFITQASNTSLEELQGAVEYLLDKVKAARQ